MLDFNNIIDISIPNSDGDSDRVTSCTYFGLESRIKSEDLEEGETIESVEAKPNLDGLKLYSHIGLAMIFDVDCGDQTTIDSSVARKAVKPWLDQVAMFGSGPAILPERILFKSVTPGKKPVLSADAILYLSSEGTALIGLEATSAGGDDNEAIELLLKEHDMIRLTNLDLSMTTSMSPYFLSAVPLIANYKGEVPTRAVLITVREE